MKSNLAHAVQNTQCIHAVTAVGVCIDDDIIKFDNLNTAMSDTLTELRKLREEARDQLMQKPISAAAKRKLNACFERMGETLVALRSEDPNKRLLIWAGHFYAAALCVHDCRIVCKALTSNPAWQRLHQATTELSDLLEEIYPDIAEVGTDVYEHIQPEHGWM